MSDPSSVAAAGDPHAVDAAEQVHHEHHSKRARTSLLAGAAALYISGTIGSNLGPALVDEHPVVVLLLSSRNRNLFLSVPYIDPIPYAVVGFLRLLLVAVVLYLVGRWFGHRAVTWTERQVGELPTLYRWFERGMDRAGWAFVLVMPGSNLVCLMAGHRRMAFRPFLTLLVIGLIGKLSLLWAAGKVFEDQIESLLDWIEQYQWKIVIALFVISFLQSARKVRKNPPPTLQDALDDEPEAPLT
jgi:membrane protein DedA with SNARE-associated domain